RTNHFAWNGPATLDDQQCVEELLFPIGAPARFPPSQGRERRQNRPHVLWIDDDVAEGRLHTPQSKHGVAVYGILTLDTFKQTCLFLGSLLAGPNAPVGNAAIEVLPDLLAKLRLGTVERVHRRVRVDRGHYPAIGRIRYATASRARSKILHPVRE